MTSLQQWKVGVCAMMVLWALPQAGHGERLADPRLVHRSAFERVVPPDDPASVPWSRSNALARELGGHAGHLRSPGAGAGAAAPASHPGHAPAVPSNGHHRHGAAPAPASVTPATAPSRR